MASLSIPGMVDEKTKGTPQRIGRASSYFLDVDFSKVTVVNAKGKKKTEAQSKLIEGWADINNESASNSRYHLKPSSNINNDNRIREMYDSVAHKTDEDHYNLNTKISLDSSSAIDNPEISIAPILATLDCSFGYARPEKKEKYTTGERATP